MSPAIPTILAFLIPVGFLAGFFVSNLLNKGTIAMITADFQTQIDRGNQALADLKASEQPRIDAAVKTATDALNQDHADNLGGVTALVDNIAQAAGA